MTLYMFNICLDKLVHQMSEKVSFSKWFIRNTIFIAIYAILAIPLYDIIAEIHFINPIHLFTPIDYAIPPIMSFAIIYVFMFYPFVLYTIGYFAYIKPNRSKQFFISLFTVYAISFIVYIIMPVEMIRPNISTTDPDFFTRVMAKYYASDPPLNCFPSLHAGIASILAYNLSKEKPKYWYVFWIFALLVMISTLFVRQHVIADEIAGFLVAIFAGKITEKYVKTEEVENKYPLYTTILAIVLATLVTIITVIPYI